MKRIDEITEELNELVKLKEELERQINEAHEELLQILLDREIKDYEKERI